MRRKRPAPEPPAKAPRVPSWLSPRARTHWYELVRELRAAGCLQQLDWRALARYCDLFEEWLELRRLIQKEGRTFPILDADGNVVNMATRPEVKQRNDIAQQLARLETDFGLTPATRGRIDLGEEKAAPTDPLSAFVAGKVIANPHGKKAAKR